VNSKREVVNLKVPGIPYRLTDRYTNIRSQYY